MAIQTKTYTLSQEITSNIFPERAERAKNQFESAIRVMKQVITCAENITDFDYDEVPDFDLNDTFVNEAFDWNDRNEQYTRYDRDNIWDRNYACSTYFFHTIAWCWLVHNSYNDVNLRKRFDRDGFKESYNELDAIDKIFNTKLNFGFAIDNEWEGNASYTEDNEPKYHWHQAGNSLRKWVKYTKIGDTTEYGPSSFLTDMKTVLTHFERLLELFTSPKWGVTRLWLLDSKSYGPYTAFNTCLIKTEDDAKKLFGITPKENPNESEILSAREEARKININLTYKSTKRMINVLYEEGTPLGFAVLPNDIPDSDKEIRNHFYYDEGNSFIKSPDSTDIEKLDYLAKDLVRNDSDKTISPFPKGTDNTIAGSAVGIEVPNAADELEAAKLQQTPPVREIVDKEAIQEQVERDLAIQAAQGGVFDLGGWVVDGEIYLSTDEPVGIANCFLKEVVNGVTRSITHTSSMDGSINIREFGRESVLRVIPPPPFQQKDFGPNLGDDDELDYIYEIFTAENTVNTSGGQELLEELVEDTEAEEITGPEIVEEIIDPRQVGGTVVNAITSEPVAGIDVTYGIGRRKVTTVTNDSGEFIIKISEPRINQLGGRLDKISKQITEAQKRTLDPEKTFFKGQQLLREGLDQLESSGVEQLENYAKELQDKDTNLSQYGNNIINGNIGLISGTDTPGIISDDGNFQAGSFITDLSNKGIQGFNNAGGAIGLYGQGIDGLNNLSNKAADLTQKGLDKLTNPLNSQTFQDVQNFKNKLNELQGKLPGRKIVIKGTGKIYKQIPFAQFLDEPPPKEVFKEVKYRTKRLTPYDADNNVIQDLGIIKLNPRTIGIRNSLREIKYSDQFGNPELKLQKFKAKIRSFDLFQALKRATLTQEIKRQIIPNLLIQVLVPLGVTYLDPILQNVKTDINEVIRSNDVLCPNQKALKKLIKTTNVLNMALTKTYTAINAATTAIQTGNKVIKVLQTAIEVYQFVPFIYAIGTPDTITKINSDKIQTTKNNLEKGKVINENILLWTMETSTILSKGVDIVKVAQGLLEKCIQETKPDRSSTEPDLTLDPIVADLEEINSFISQQATTPDTFTGINMEVNGFTLEIEEETVNDNPATTNQQLKYSLPRKRAIAKDGNGVIIIRGEYSFTADTDILLEELKFYIQVNDLKAF